MLFESNFMLLIRTITDIDGGFKHQIFEGFHAGRNVRFAMNSADSVSYESDGHEKYSVKSCSTAKCLVDTSMQVKKFIYAITDGFHL